MAEGAKARGTVEYGMQLHGPMRARAHPAALRPQDIESTAERSSPRLLRAGCCAAFAIESHSKHESQQAFTPSFTPGIHTTIHTTIRTIIHTTSKHHQQTPP